MRILIAAPGPPAAGGKGYQVRLLNQIVRLADRHELSLVTFASSGTVVDSAALRACRSVAVIPWSLRGAITHGLWRSGRLPASVSLYGDRRMSRAIMESFTTNRPDIVHLELGRMAPYMRYLSDTARVLDLVDAGGLNMSERAKAAPPIIRQALRVEASRLRSFEKQMIGQAHRTLLISRRDQAYLGDPASSRVNANGIDPREAPGLEKRDRSTLIFSGTMSYFPNGDAVRWFANDILPLVKSQVADAQFRIVGRSPGRAVIDLGGVNGIQVTGAVTSVFEELGRAIAAVCPLRYGSGLQTKILEAMAVGTPVIATSKAIEGLPGSLAAAVRVADSPEEFARAVVDVLRNPGNALIRAGLALTNIRASHTWRHSVDQLESYYEEAIRESRSASA